MTALRTTSTAAPRHAPPSIRLWVLGLAALGLFGCGTASPPSTDPIPPQISAVPGLNDPNWLTSREKLPPPSLDRLDYDPDKRTLTLYDLPGRDHWMVQLPEELTGRRVGPVHRLPEGIDPTKTLVFYARAGVKVSTPVTVAAIEAGRRPHASLALNR